ISRGQRPSAVTTLANPPMKMNPSTPFNWRIRRAQGIRPAIRRDRCGGLSGRFGGRFGGLAADHGPQFSSASGHAIKNEFDRSDLNPVAPGIFGAIERM